jgi:hypothetical protein
MSLCHGWCWQPTKTASCIHIRHTKQGEAHSYAGHGHKVAALKRYSHFLSQISMFWVTCGAKVMSLHHCWGWQPTQTASDIHIRQIECVYALWYAVHGHKAVALNSCTHITCVRFYDSGSLDESKWCHYVMVEAENHLKLLPASTLDIYKLYEHIDMLSMGMWQ